MIWHSKYIRLPWVNPAKEKPSMENGFDCYSLVKHALKEQKGYAMKDLMLETGSPKEMLKAFKDSGMYEDWAEVDIWSAREFDVVEMGSINNNRHIGLLVLTNEGLKILHSSKTTGVILSDFNPMTRLADTEMIRSVRRCKKL